ncbi:MAG: CsbD family protein [Candidatus Accumulibacter propinquus]|jgi:uncharacterized protein YjbJ (UPF0337 family)
MNKDQVKGRVKKAKGKVKKVAGKLVGSKGMEEQGKADETAGAVQAAYGDVRRKAKPQSTRDPLAGFPARNGIEAYGQAQP